MADRVVPDVDLTLAMADYADGDPAAFEIVYAALAPVVRACQRRWVGDATLAEDLTQETFLRLHRVRLQYRAGAPVGPWVLTIARRLSIDALRRRGAWGERLTGDGSLPEVGVAPVEAGEAPEPDVEAMMAALRAAVSTLPDGQREVVALHKLEGLPLAEVAARLGIREGAARVRAHRGYARLRALLGLGGGEGSAE